MGLEALPFQGLNNTTRTARLTQWSGIKRFPRRVKHINFASSLTLSPFLRISNKQMHDQKKKKKERGDLDICNVLFPARDFSTSFRSVT